MKKIFIYVILLAGCTNQSVKNSSESVSVPEPEIVVGQLDNRYWTPKRNAGAVYPRAALMKGIQGCVNVTYIVTKNGSIANPIIIKSIPEGVFDEAALKATRKFKYTPGVDNPEHVPVRTHNVFAFTVKGASKETQQWSYWNDKCRI